MRDHFSPPNRILDPIHGLIRFGDTAFDRLVLRLLDSRVMQRLRHIRQLGLTDLVYPAATHNRFSHSLGVFAVARQMTERLRHNGAEDIAACDVERAQLAALLHDIGHGPYSHMFERAQPAGLRQGQWHEVWGRALLSHPEIVAIFAEYGREQDLHVLAEQQHQPNCYIQAIVSGTFDADRMDYLHRDQVMTGSFQGRFDWPWLMDNLEWNDDLRTIVLSPRAVHAAEEYLLARSHLYQTVYFHRTVCGAEGILKRALRRFAEHCREGTLDEVARVAGDSPLRHWYNQQGEDVDFEVFLSLDDETVSMLMYSFCDSADDTLRRAAELRYRRLPHCYEPSGEQRDKVERWLEGVSAEQLQREWGAYADRRRLTAYHRSQPILIRQQRGCVELSTLSAVVRALSDEKNRIDLLRFYSDSHENLCRLRQHITSL